MSKPIKYLVIHCTATPEGRKVSRQDIEKWHLEGRGWSRLGYSDMIHLNGEVENLTPYDGDNLIQSHEMTWGAKGVNQVSRHVVYVGGMNKEFTKPKDTRTAEQLLALRNYVLMMLQIHPGMKVAGHNQFAAKACPSFDVPKWAREIGIPEDRIYNAV